MDTNTIKAKLILKAIEKHGKISPCGGDHLLDGFSEYEEVGWFFYYNVKQNTYAIVESEVVCT